MSNNIESIYPNAELHGEAYDTMKIEILLSLNGDSGISMTDLNKKYGGHNLERGMLELDAQGCFIKGKIKYQPLTYKGELFVITYGKDKPLTSKALNIIQHHLSNENN